MTVSDLDFASLCYATYFDASRFDRILSVSEVYVGIKERADLTVVAFRGSAAGIDWIRDFEYEMIEDPDLGGVEMGFMTGLRETLKQLQPFTKPVYITGHSLGAARALIFAALMCVSGMKPESVVTFGSPRPGGEKLKTILAPVSIKSYRNGKDPVTGVPFTLANEPYCHPRDLTPVLIQPIAGDPYLMMRDHHIQNYLGALVLAGDANG